MAQSVMDGPTPSAGEESASAFKRGLMRQVVDMLTGGVGSIPIEAMRSVNTPATRMLGGLLGVTPKTKTLPEAVAPDPPESTNPETLAARDFGTASANAVFPTAALTSMLKQRKGQLNMFIGPQATDYPKDKAKIIQDEWKAATKGKGMEGKDIDVFNQMMMDQHNGWMEPVTNTVMFFKKDTPWATDYLQSLKNSQLLGNDPIVPLNKLLPPKDLVSYPSMGQIPVAIGSGKGGSLSYAQRPEMSNHATKINIGAGSDVDYMKRVLMHEVAHGISAKEGLPPGGSPTHVEHTRAYRVPVLEQKERQNSLTPADRAELQMYDSRGSDFNLYESLSNERVANTAMRHRYSDMNSGWDRHPSMRGAVIGQGYHSAPGSPPIAQYYHPIESFLQGPGGSAPLLKYQPYAERPTDYLVEALQRRSPSSR